MAEILIIDDDFQMSEALGSVIERLGYNVTRSFTLQDGLCKTQTGNFDVVFLDVMMPDGNGLEYLSLIHETISSPEIIIITAFGEPIGAELAIESGAWDYIKKPASVEEMTLPLIRALQFREEKSKRKPILLKRERIIGKSSKLMETLAFVAQAAGTGANVLITGETGTGKELFARAIHENSSRANKRFVVVDCAALPESLIESILFGHEKGAFTGAEQSKTGLFEQANSGTLFLDEVGELPLVIQRTFLRIIQERQFRPVGSKSERKSDFRLIAATNRDLEQMVQKGQFRRDLLYRLHSLTITVPPLRERNEDINELTTYYINKLCELHGMEPKRISPDFLETLNSYSWPGNVRELINTMEHVLTAASFDSTLFSYYLPTYVRVKVTKDSFVFGENANVPENISDAVQRMSVDTFSQYKEFRDKMEYLYLQRLMANTKGSKKKACQLSGLSRTRLYQLLKKHSMGNNFQHTSASDT